MEYNLICFIYLKKLLDVINIDTFNAKVDTGPRCKVPKTVFKRIQIMQQSC